MENKKESAIEYLLDNIYLLNSTNWKNIVEKSKAMEKEQAKRMYTEEEVYDLLVKWDMYQKGEPRVDEDEIPNGFMSFNEWFKQQDNGK